MLGIQLKFNPISFFEGLVKFELIKLDSIVQLEIFFLYLYENLNSQYDRIWEINKNKVIHFLKK